MTISDEKLAGIKTAAWNCDRWPGWLFDLAEVVSTWALDSDASQEQASGLAALLAIEMQASRATPAGVTVTEDMVERACEAYAAARYDGSAVWPVAFSSEEVRDGRRNMRSALTAALCLPKPTLRVSQPDLSATGEGEAESVAPYTAEDGLRRVREIALQSEAAPLCMGEIIKVADMALGEKTAMPEWIGKQVSDETKSPGASGEVESALRDEIERWRQNSVDTWAAMTAMRNSINEVIPLPSVESDLLQGPEDSVFCVTVAGAVVHHVSALQAKLDEAKAVLADAIDHYDRNVCAHESVHRGGAIWTICDECGAKWADDRGGFVPYSDPPGIVRARDFLSALSPTSTSGGGNGFARYRRKQIAELRPWTPGDDMAEVSVSSEDRKAGSPKAGDMIARNPKNHADQWLVAAAYFADNFEPVTND